MILAIGWATVIFCGMATVSAIVVYLIEFAIPVIQRELTCVDCGQTATDCEYVELNDTQYLMCRKCRLEFAKLKYERERNRRWKKREQNT